MKLIHFVDILKIFVLIDYLVIQYGVRASDSIPYSVITNSMISAPAYSEVRHFGFEMEWLHRMISRITYISKNLCFYVSAEV